ncbi:MAG: aminotransferase class I/II-fold pyridoxal phosphate-dependent enzyme [Candidatus Eremiobacterota bacterium]
MSHRIETRLIHAGEVRPGVQGAVVLPVFQSANYEYEGESDYHDLKYIRLNNTPNHRVLHQKLAALEGGEAALVTSSGMAAISSTLLSCVGPGEHLLAQSCLYGGTHTFLTHDWPGFGRTVDFLDLDQPDTWAARVRPETRAIYVETISNPLMQVFDLTRVAAFARQHGLLALIDNTFATPLNFRPLEHGFDVVLHSCTKYLNGHSDIVAGAVVGSAERIRKIVHLVNHLGGSLDPHACFLLHRGIKTLAVRLRFQNESALRIARYLESHPEVARVHYPGLEAHPHHTRASGLLQGFGGMLSFELKQESRADEWIKRTSLPVEAASLGGVESLLTRPSTTSHSGMSAEERRQSGISDGLIRLSVGLEATEDLIDDFASAFDAVFDRKLTVAG